MCVCLVYFYTHIFLYGFLTYFFFYSNQQTKLVEGVVILGLDAVKPRSNFFVSD